MKKVMSTGLGQSVHTVGIDLGTTFSAIAIVDQNGQAKAIPNAEGLLTTPSVAIWYNNAFVAGKPALDLVAGAPPAEHEHMTKSLIRGVKRMIGQPLNGELTTGGHCTTPIEVCAAILAKLARDASAHLGFLFSVSVLTVLAHFGDADRYSMHIAAQMPMQYVFPT